MEVDLQQPAVQYLQLVLEDAEGITTACNTPVLPVYKDGKPLADAVTSTLAQVLGLTVEEIKRACTGTYRRYPEDYTYMSLEMICTMALTSTFDFLMDYECYIPEKRTLVMKAFMLTQQPLE